LEKQKQKNNSSHTIVGQGFLSNLSYYYIHGSFRDAADPEL